MLKFLKKSLFCKEEIFVKENEEYIFWNIMKTYFYFSKM